MLENNIGRLNLTGRGSTGRIKCVVTVGSKKGGKLQSKTVTPSTTVQTVKADAGYYGLNTVNVEAVKIDKAPTITPSETVQTLDLSEGALGIAGATIEAIPSKYHDTSDATATAANVLKGCTAYNASGKITGTAEGGGADLDAYTKVFEDYEITDASFSSEAVTLYRLPVGVKKISCTKIKSVYNDCCEQSDTLEEVTCDECNTIGTCAFKNCSALKTISLPKLDTVPADAFYNVGSLVTDSCTFEFPNVKTVDDYGFRYFMYFNPAEKIILKLPLAETIGLFALSYTGLAQVDIGATVTLINGWTFQRSTRLTSFICRAVTPPVLNNSLNLYLSTAKIYVPDNSVEQYKVATNWSTYASRITPLSEYSEE